MRPARGGAATPSPSHPLAGVQPIYEDFRPISEWQQDEESDILLIFLPGFLRQHLKVSTEGKNIVRVRGERLVAGNKWSRLQEDYQVPDNCNIRAIRARFEGGILTITMPWKKDSQPPQDRPKETPKLPTPPTPDFQKQEMSPKIPPKYADDIPPKTISPADIQKESAEPRPQKGADDIPPKTISPAGIQKESAEPRPQKGADDIPLKTMLLTDIQKQPMEPRPDQKGVDKIPPNAISSPETKKPEMSPRKSPTEPRPKKGVDDIIPPEIISPSEIQNQSMQPRPGQKGVNKIPPNPISTPATEKQEMSPRKSPIEPRPQKGVDDYSPKVVTPPPSITAEKGKDEEKLSEPKAIKGQDEKRGRIISHKPITPTRMTFEKDVERKETRKETGNDTKAKITKSENIGKSKEGTEKISKEAVGDQTAENVPRITVANEKEKSEKTQEEIEYKGQRESQTATTIAQPSGIGYGLGKYKKAVKNLVELNEERQMLVNIGVAVLVIVALGTYISYTVGSDEA